MKKYLIPMVLLVSFILVITAGGKGETPETTVAATETGTEAVTTTATPTTTAVPETTTELETTIAEPETTTMDLTGLAINPLTGMYIDEEVAVRRPVGVMINNHHAAMPQYGIGQADVVYETLVEGGIARLFAVFTDFDAEKIGPVRSARHYYLDFAFDFDALYAHYGHSPQAWAAFTALNPPNLNGMRLEDVMCYRDTDNGQRKWEHSLFTSYEGLMAGWEREKYRKNYNEDFSHKFTFAEETVDMSTGEDAHKVILDWSYYQYAWFDYDQAMGKYLRFQFDGPHIDALTDEQLAYDNIIIQLTDMWKIKGDSEGRLDMNLSTSGEGYYVTGGKIIPITWSKTDHYNPTQYYTKDGEVLEMAMGKTWIAVFPSYRPEGIIIE